MTSLMIYLWTRLDPVLAASVITAIVSGMLSAIASICLAVEISTYL